MTTQQQDTATAADVRWTAKLLLDRLHRHYIKPSDPLPGGVFIPECGWNGQTGSTRCDALYLGFTSTSGRLLKGHEVKISRADWRTELAKPHKAGGWADQCHEWWVVAPAGVVPLEELPDGWGLMVPGPSKTRMAVARPAVTHRDRTPSWNAMRSIVARYDTLRAQAITASNQHANQEVDRRVQDELEKRWQRGDRNAGLSYNDRELLNAAITLRDTNGVNLSTWDHRDGAVTPARFALALRLAAVLDLLPERYDGERAQRIAEGAVKATEALTRLVAELPDALAAANTVVTA